MRQNGGVDGRMFQLLWKSCLSSPLKNFNFLSLKEHVITLNVLIKITEANGLKIDKQYNE